VHRHNFPLKEMKNRWGKCSTIKNVDYKKLLPIAKYKDEWVEYFGTREF
jgi:predicted metal-dependent hydrolase